MTVHAVSHLSLARGRIWSALVFLISLSILPVSSSLAGGIGVATDPEPIDPTIQTQAIRPFHAWRPGQQGDLFFRDLEFLLDDRYGIGLTPTITFNLNNFGRTLCETESNPWQAPLSDVRFFYDYFNRIGATYSINPLDSLTRFGQRDGDLLVSTYPSRDRRHADVYLTKPGTASFGGVYPAVSVEPAEDSTTGVPRGDPVRHANAVELVGPQDPTDPSWVLPGRIANVGVIHELQHSLPDTGVVETGLGIGFDTEMMSAAAEFLSGIQDTSAKFEAHYTWSLTSNTAAGAEPTDCRYTRHVGQNYQARSLLAAYVASNFRGQDTTFSISGIADDLLRKWVVRYASGLSIGTSLGALDFLVGDDSCYSCSNMNYLQGLSNKDRVQLILHNWRVANYVNNPFVAEGQYGYPPHLGFAPGKQIKAWQDLDGPANNPDCYKDDMLAIPPIVTVRPVHAYRETTFSRQRTFDRGPGYLPTNYPLVLQPFGSEYWVVRADTAALGGALKDLIVTIRSVTPSFCGRKNRLVASVVGYAHVDPDTVESTLWSRPHWVSFVGAPTWTDVDSLSNDLILVVPQFGTANKSALVAISLGTFELPGGGYNVSNYQEAIEYRVTFALAEAGTVTPPLLVAGLAQNESAPAWSPEGTQIAFVGMQPPATVSQIYSGPLAGSHSPLAPSSLPQFSPDWSSQGDLIAYVQETAGGACEIFVKNPNAGAQPVQLTSLAGFAVVPSFQPNGEGIAFLFKALPAESTFKLMLMHKDGTSLHKVFDFGAAGPAILPPRWSPDGQRLWVVKQNRLHSVAVSGGPLVDRGDVASDIAFGFDLHPDSNRTVFNQAGLAPSRPCPATVGFSRIVLRNRNITPPDTNAIFYRSSSAFKHPRIAPDGVQIAYSSDQNGNLDVFAGRLTVNDPPHFVGLSDTPGTCGQPLTIALNATDANGEPVQYSGAYLPPGSSVMGNTFTWPSVQGVHYVVFRAQDGSGGVASKVVRLGYDDVPPSAAALGFSGVTSSSITVEWIAPGDNGTSGTAAAYDLRYSLTPLNAANFLSGQPVAMSPPQPGGTQEQKVVTGLSTCTIYYWGLRTRDVCGNWSLLGAGATATSCDGGCGSGWCGEAARPSEAGPVVLKEVLRLRGQKAGLAAVAMAHVGASSIRLDSLRLVGIPRGADSIAVVRDGKIAIGARRAAERVEAVGEIAAIVRDSGYVTAIGETLTVHFTPSGSESLGAAVIVETETGVYGDSGEVRVLVPNGQGGWFATAARSPEAGGGALVVEAVYSDIVRLVFGGECRVTGIYHALPSSQSPALIPLALTTARHSRTGELTLEEVELGDVVLEPGEWLDLQFRIPSSGPTPKDVFLLFDGAAASASPLGTQTKPTATLPPSFALEQSVPNPFGQTTLIRFALPTRSKVTMELFDLTGRRVRTLARREMAAGFHQVDWNGRDDAGRRLSPGVYVYRLTAGSSQASKRLILMP